MKRMSRHDEKAWIAKTERLNATRAIAVGDDVTDVLLGAARVTRIKLPEGGDPKVDHGTVEIKYQESSELEHYPYTTWTKYLRHR